METDIIFLFFIFPLLLVCLSKAGLALCTGASFETSGTGGWSAASFVRSLCLFVRMADLSFLAVARLRLATDYER